MSKEHIWSKWLGELIPPAKAHAQSAEAFNFDRVTNTFTVTHPTSLEKKRGCLSQRKVRKVCEKCNNGWMSRAVDAAKPVARPLILGRPSSCDESDLCKLTTWLAITSIMQEFISTPDAIFIPAEDRKTLMDKKLPPADWTIWLGYYGGELWRPMGHTHFTAKLEDKISKDAGIEPHRPDCYIQIATFTIRNLLVHVYTATTLGLVSEYRQFVRDQNWNLFQIWPPNESPMAWPQTPILEPELGAIVTRFSAVRLGLTVDPRFCSKYGV
jgi:hypothetical protein